MFWPSTYTASTNSYAFLQLRDDSGLQLEEPRGDADDRPATRHRAAAVSASPRRRHVDRDGVDAYHHHTCSAHRHLFTSSLYLPRGHAESAYVLPRLLGDSCIRYKVSVVQHASCFPFQSHPNPLLAHILGSTTTIPRQAQPQEQQSRLSLHRHVRRRSKMGGGFLALVAGECSHFTR